MSASFLKIGGELIQDAILESVDIEQELNHHWWCRVSCRQTEDERFPFEQCLGKDLQLITYGEDNAKTVFDGFVLEAELEYEIFGSYSAKLVAVTRSYKSDLTPRKAYYLGKTLMQIAEELAGRAGLKITVTHPDRKPLNYVQWAESDFDFLNRLVDDHGCWLRPTAEGIEIRDAFQDGGELQWREEDGLLKFKTKGRLAQPAFNGAHYNPHEMKSGVFQDVADEAQFFDSVGPLVDAVKTESKKLPPGYVAQRSRTVTLGDFEQLLKKESVRSIGANIQGFGESRDASLCPGDQVKIQGVLDAHGTYGITKVEHQWTATGYRNRFWCTPWKNYTNPEPPAFKPWFGVVPARVVEHNDPKKMGRIRVQYFWQEDGPAHWARMLTPHAGDDRGFMFMPEVGDEVAVAFEDGDPERPYVLGCVWNAVDQAPRQELRGNDIAPNEVKRIVTKGGNRIQFVDKPGKQVISLATPNSNRISLIEGADETGRPALFLYSSGDIMFSAPNGRIHFHCKFFSRNVGALWPSGSP